MLAGEMNQRIQPLSEQRRFAILACHDGEVLCRRAGHWYSPAHKKIPINGTVVANLRRDGFFVVNELRTHVVLTARGVVAAQEIKRATVE